MYLERGTTAYNAYCQRHPDILEGLKDGQIRQFNKYLNEEMVRKLKRIKALTEGTVTFIGIENGWSSSISNVRFITNQKTVYYMELSKLFPTRYRLIQQSFSEIKSELEYVAYLVREGEEVDWIIENQKGCKEVFASDYTSARFATCREFYLARLPLPLELIGEYKTAYNYVFKELKLKEFYEQTGDDYKDFINSDVALIKQINEAVENGLLPSTGTMEYALWANNINSVIMSLAMMGLTPENLVDIPYKEVYKTTATNGIRNATVGEIERRPVQTSLVRELVVDQAVHDLLLCFAFLCTGNKEHLEKAIRVNPSTFANLISGTAKQWLAGIFKYCLSADFKYDINRAIEARARVEYPQTAADEIFGESFMEKCRQSYDDAMKYLREAGLTAYQAQQKKEFKRYGKVVDISKKAFKGYELSDPQKYVISRYYDDMKLRESTPNFYSEELRVKIAEMEDWFNWPKGYWLKDIADKIRKYYKCSEKQLRCIDQEYEKMIEEKQEQKTINENSYFRELNTGVVDSYSTKPIKSAKQQMMEMAQGNDPDLAYNTGANNEVEDKFNFTPTVPTFGPSFSDGNEKDSNKGYTPISLCDYEWDDD